MKIKRILALLLCIVVVCASLVGCKQDIADYLESYREQYKPEVVVDLYYDFYIIVGEGTDEMAMTTVNEKLNQLLYDRYKSKIVMHFISEEDYAQAVKAAANSTEAPSIPRGYEYGGKIVLINGMSLLADLQNSLADLKPYLDSNDYNFGTLKSQIATSLMDAAAYTHVENEKEVTEVLGIPNNRVVGEYEYILINRDIAVKKLSYSDANEKSELRQITSLDSEDAQALIAGAVALGYSEEDIIKTAKGSYKDKAAFEADKTNGDWICNISKYPSATTEASYASAFGVVPAANVVVDGEVVSDNVARAMEIIYGFNTVAELKNTLQFGVQNTNFRLDDEGFIHREDYTVEGNIYNMDISYTGDIFMSYYCEGIWTPDQALNGKKQNLESFAE